MTPSEKRKEKESKQPAADAAATERMSPLSTEGQGEAKAASPEAQRRFSASIFPRPDEGEVPIEVADNVKALEDVMGMEVWLLVQAVHSDTEGPHNMLGEATRAEFIDARNRPPKDEQIALLIDSPGGIGSEGYRLAKFLRRHCGGFVAVVPRQAKSAATMLALGADEIVLGAFGELGPLDSQVHDPEYGGYHSALDETKAMYRIRSFALEAYDRTKEVMENDSNLKNTAELIPFAMGFALGLVRPLLEDLDTVHYTLYERVLRNNEEYASRLLRHHPDTRVQERANDIAFHLVQNYFDHGFDIDVEEARGFGLETVRGPNEKEAPILDELATQLDGLFIFGRVEKTPGGGRSA
jgi:hypothetical protein